MVLTGFMGTGKTYVGRVLAKKLGTTFIDTDTLIEKDAGMSIREIFERFGEARFRSLEREAISRVSDQESSVIAVGGGAIVDPANLEALRRNGIVICLTASPETILSRVERNSDRPLLQVNDKIGKIKELLSVRAPHYAKADMSISTDDKSPDQVAEDIMELLKSGWQRD